MIEFVIIEGTVKTRKIQTLILRKIQLFELNLGTHWIQIRGSFYQLF